MLRIRDDRVSDPKFVRYITPSKAQKHHRKKGGESISDWGQVTVQQKICFRHDLAVALFIALYLWLSGQDMDKVGLSEV